MKSFQSWTTIGIMVVLLLSVNGAVVAEVHDFGGETVQFVSWDNREPWEGTSEYDRWIEAMDLYNVNFAYGVMPDIIGGMMAGVLAGDAPELVEFLSNVQMLPLAVQGAFHQLNDFLDDEYWALLPDPYQGRSGAKDALAILGNTYGTISIAPIQTAVAMIWNKELFEREGLPSLYDLMDSGEWTWEKMKEIAIQATRDTTGDGEIDQWGIGGIITDPEHFAGAALMTNDVELFREVDGKVVYNLSNNAAAIEIYQHVYDLSNVHNAVAPVGHWSDLSLFAQGRVAMQIIPFWQQDAGPVRSAIDVGLAYLPKGSRVDDYKIPLYSIAGLGVPVTVEDPQAVIELHHAIYPPEEFAWEQVESAAAAQHDFESYDLVYEIATNWEPVSPFISLFINNGLWPAYMSIVTGEKLPAEALSEVEPLIQAALDDLLGQ